MASLVEHDGCFICGKQITGTSKQMMTATASHTKTPLVDKLQIFIGSEFVVIVNNSDAVCENCTLLFDQLDELELQLDHVRNVLRDHLTSKYPMCFSHEADDNNAIFHGKDKKINTATVDTTGDANSYSRQHNISYVNQKVNGKSDNLSNELCFCGICEKQINEESSLRKHITENHISKEIGVASDQKTKRISLIFKCSVCGLQFSREQLCQDHIDSCHINRLSINNDLNKETLEIHSGSGCIKIEPETSASIFNTKDNKEQNILINNCEILKHNSTMPNVELLKAVNISDTLEAESNKVGNLEQDINPHGSDIGIRDSDVSTSITCCNQVKDKSTSRVGNSLTDQSEYKDRTEAILPESLEPTDRKNNCSTNLMLSLSGGCSETTMALTNEISSVVENTGISSVNTLNDNTQQLTNSIYGSSTNVFIKSEIEIDVSENSCDSIEGASESMVCDTNSRSESLDEQNCTSRKNSSSFVCIICKETLDSRKSLDLHITDAHPVTKPNYCRACTTDHSNKDELINHIRVSHIGEKLCTICSKRFRTEGRFLTHVDFEHRDNLICSVCQMQCKSVKKLIAHEKGHKTEYICEICCKILKTRTSLKSHQIIKHTREYPCICETCGKGFISKHALYEHKGKHSNESRYICDICGKGYMLYDTYHKHRNHHDNPYPKQCTICHQNFRSSSRLSEHMRRKHTLERPYKCPHCPLSFHISNRLKNHVFKHTKQYPHTCPLCDKGFSSRIKYASHLGAKHGDYSLIRDRLPNNKERQEEWLKFSRNV